MSAEVGSSNETPCSTTVSSSVFVDMSASAVAVAVADLGVIVVLEFLSSRRMHVSMNMRASAAAR